MSDLCASNTSHSVYPITGMKEPAMKSPGLIPTLSFRKPILRMFSTHGVSQQEDVGFALKLLEVIGVLEHRAVLVVGMDELALESV